MKGQLTCTRCGYGNYVEAVELGEEVSCANCNQDLIVNERDFFYD